MTEIRVLLPLAEGVEEMEAVIVADVLRRAGARVDLKGLTAERLVKASRGVLLGHEGELSGDEDADLIVLPGGSEGARRLASDRRVLDLLRRFEANGKWIAAVCAAPSVLVAAGVGRGRRMTSHPGVREQVAPHAGAS
jgi:4-methyl-5(b-hydroxyethyl)-thiazole monophosphate biosynthesis